MNPRCSVRLFAVICSLPLFAGCGGGGSDGDSAPPPRGPSPPTTPVTIFASPTVGTYASLGSSMTGAMSSIAPNARFTDISLESSYQPVLRYTSSGKYEIQVPGAAFDELVSYKGIASPPQPHLSQTDGTPPNVVILAIKQYRYDGYRDSELASWSEGVTPRSGYLAIGTPTPSAGLPTSGSATFRGRLYGLADVTYLDQLAGVTVFAGVDGTITLTVDYAARTIAGTIDVSFDFEPIISTASFSTATTLPGTDGWQGTFVTSESGFNEFKVMLTGPDASELIGSWAIPITVDGETHQFTGAWIAKRQ